MLLVVAGRWSSFCRCTGAEPGRALGGIPSRLALEALLLAVPGRLLPRLLPPLTEACADPGELLPKSSSRFTRVRATPSNPGALAGAGCPCPPVSSACCQGRGGLPPEPAVDGRLAGADVGRDPAPGPKSCCGRDDASSGAGRGRRAPAVLGREPELLGREPAVLGREPELLGGRSALAATFVRPPPTRSAAGRPCRLRTRASTAVPVQPAPGPARPPVAGMPGAVASPTPDHQPQPRNQQVSLVVRHELWLCSKFEAPTAKDDRRGRRRDRQRRGNRERRRDRRGWLSSGCLGAATVRPPGPRTRKGYVLPRLRNTAQTAPNRKAAASARVAGATGASDDGDLLPGETRCQQARAGRLAARCHAVGSG